MDKLPSHMDTKVRCLGTIDLGLLQPILICSLHAAEFNLGISLNQYDASFELVDYAAGIGKATMAPVYLKPMTTRFIGRNSVDAIGSKLSLHYDWIIMGNLRINDWPRRILLV
jgi:hypothetical protein